MSLAHYEPWGLINQLHGDIDQLFGARKAGNDTLPQREGASAWVPAVDIIEEDKRYIIHADVPGVEPKDIEINLEDGVLSVQGERVSETHEEGENYRRTERVRGNFVRRFNLPDSIDPESVSASSSNGVLEIVIMKQQKKQPQRIEVHPGG